MSKIVLSPNASGSGIFTIDSPNSNNNRTVSLPDAAGNLVLDSATQTLTNKTINASQLVDASITQAKLGSNVVGVGPTASINQISGQTVTTNTFTKINLDTENWDIGSYFNNTGSTVGGVPSYSYLPTVAGYYMVTAYGFGSGTAGVYLVEVIVFKNGGGSGVGGSLVFDAGTVYSSAGSNYSAVIYMNGTTDYLDVRGRIVGPGTLTYANTNFCAVLVRAA